MQCASHSIPDSPLYAHTCKCKLQALVYDSLPSTTATTDYTTGLEKLSVNRQLFADAQIAVSL